MQDSMKRAMAEGIRRARLNWHPSDNARALGNFLNYAERRVDGAPLDRKSALAALAWLRGMLTPPKG